MKFSDHNVNFGMTIRNPVTSAQYGQGPNREGGMIVDMKVGSHCIRLERTEDYHEDYGDCLFFHFPSFEEPPEVYVGGTLDTDFDDEHWTHFTKDVDFNIVISQAIFMAGQ